MNVPAEIESLFDERSYLEQYQDIARAVDSGKLKSGLSHFLRHGQYEGRAIRGFDSAFYLRTYPLAEEEIAAGRAPTPIVHYLQFGRARGYLASPTAPRPDNAAQLATQFGGFWTDQPNSWDLIRGRLEAGLITAIDAEHLRFWVTNGYLILENAIPESVLDAATKDLDRGYSGRLPELLFECQDVIGSRKASPWRKEMNEVPAKALDLHYQSVAVRELIFSEVPMRFLGLLFDSPAFATQTLGFLVGSAQSGHQDSAYVAYSIPRQFCASWIALEDVTLGAGELFYYPGSHRFPDHLYSGKYKSIHEAMRLEGCEFPTTEVNRHMQELKDRATEAGLKKELLAAKRGDVLIWHADLIHGGNPIRAGVTRKSVVTHYCPKHVSPLYTELKKTRVFHYRNHIYTTAYYTKSEPSMEYR
jgi:ectoine hydroxylase-related dioxygenase (phytanoyl-CoA dioxygenase family)